MIIYLVFAHSFEEAEVVSYGGKSSSHPVKMKVTRQKTLIGQGLDLEALIKRVENAYSEIDDNRFERVTIEKAVEGLTNKSEVMLSFTYGHYGWEQEIPILPVTVSTETVKELVEV